MAKKEFPDKASPKIKDEIGPGFESGLMGDFKSKLSAITSKSFGVFKFILGIALLPFLYSTLASFLNEFGLVAKPHQALFYNGMITFLAIYLFVWEPVKIYNAGHKLLEFAFSFFKPMVNVAPFLLPIYTIFIFILYSLLSLFIKSAWLINGALFLAGFSIILHLVFSAKTIRSKKGDFLKANYIFGQSFILILNVTLLALCFSLIFKEFSFVNFCNIAVSIAKNIFYAIFKQLFIV
ncbi:MAG: hypothetical protein M0Q96_01155 [Candidatus Omnitrophica bacterium]|jgi:hypothetical protein|nr:hypothetical protein [Candidatus Omnitrophota bacterium]